MNLTALAIAKNVKLTKPQMNLLAKLDELGIVISDTPADKLHINNPITGYSAEVSYLVGCLVNLAYKLIRSYEQSPTYTMTFNGKKVSIQTYDRVKMLILALDPAAYRDFID